ncbi:arginine--tRNA ligase [Pseudoroseomonas ludipueritiae]|uniref:Arginine--tRNA ligase n=1 Tax=Pseudoroseomonas ludipueritiae TaxID=198093 RepID=A0ABR7RCF5_9PROT|nr:arginine--tRNA ligase [Pseudoroseomonas ludipueritiae]MBC9179363.1 arginine--tRNA ligase [Pseudoroseomonas ludipueritiae]MCG7360439.1 arginine--tRNA ligase [Roseomonas sp. ACRSG]
MPQDPTAPDIFAVLRAEVVACLRRLLPDLPEDAFARVLVEPPRDASHGDMATNAAMVVAKLAKMPPPKLAAQLSEALAALPMVAEAAPAGPGFVNLRLREDFVLAQIPALLRVGEAYGTSPVGQGIRVNVEYVSANPTGPMHVGHCRGAVVGDALANLLLKAGYDVTKEYYINDAGAQVRALAYAAYWRYLQALGTTLTEEEYSALVPGGLQYRGEYLIPVGEALKQQHGDALAPGARPDFTEERLALIQRTAVSMMMDEIREDLAALGVVHDVFISELKLVQDGVADRAIAELSAKGLVYEGVLEPPKGKLPDDWEPRPQTLFASTKFGDDVDRPLRKSDGSNTYFANDIGNHADKIARGMQQLVQVWGADHGGYVSRMKAATKALSDGAVPLDVVLCQIVKVLKDGEPVRMSKRAGSYITLRDLIDEVGRDAVRFTMLTRKSDAQMEFDLTKVVEQSRENPVFYVQYAHARCRSVLRQAEDPSAEDLATAPLDALKDPAELALLRRLTTWPRTVEAAAAAREPHRIAFYLHDLASDFHILWNRGREDATLRFILAEQPEATRARLALVAATATVIRSGLAVMGVTPVEEMR